MSSVKDMTGDLDFYPLNKPVEMPQGAERNAPSKGDIVGRLPLRNGLKSTTVNLYCHHWYWSPNFGCIMIETYYLSPWDNGAGHKKKKMVGKLVKGWSINDK